jgi:hypothetical protein
VADTAAPDRAALLTEYRRLVDDVLPERARREGWVVRADHCFGRILLDHAVGGCWYDVLDRRRSAGPAHRQLDDARLARAVDLGHAVERAGDPLLRRLNEQSLRWRGKPVPARARAGRLDRPGDPPARLGKGEGDSAGAA